MKIKLLEINLIAITLSLLFVGCGGSNNTKSTYIPSGFTKTTNTFTANDSNLTWQDNANVYKIGAGSDIEASEICQNRTIDGFSDWRLPTEKELFNLYSKNWKNLSYTIENYRNESYYDYMKLRYFTWTNKHFVSDDSTVYYGVINEENVAKTKSMKYSEFIPVKGHQEKNMYSIRCVRDNTK